MRRAVSSFIGLEGNEFEDGQDLLEILGDDRALDICERALDAYSKGLLFSKAVRPKEEHSFLRRVLAEFADSGDTENFERAFDYCVAFELGIGEFGRAALTAGMYRRRMRVKAALIEAIAFSYSEGQEGNFKAAKHLIEEFDRPPRTEARKLLLEEARIYSGKDPDLLAEIKRREPGDSGRPSRGPLAGRILVVGDEAT